MSRQILASPSLTGRLVALAPLVATLSPGAVDDVTGNINHTRRWDRAGGNDEAVDIAPLSTLSRGPGFVVTGSSWISSTGFDVATLWYDIGVLTPHRTDFIILGGSETAAGLDFQASGGGGGTVYVGGTSVFGDTPATADFIVAAYDADFPIQLWVQQFGRVVSSLDRMIGLEAAGEALNFTGTTQITGQRPDIWTVRFDLTTLQLDWENIIDRGGDDRPAEVIIDNNFDVYVVGRSQGGPGVNYDIALTKLPRFTGAPTSAFSAPYQNWPIFTNGTANGNDYGNAVAVNTAFGFQPPLSVTGQSFDVTTDLQILTVRYIQEP